MFISENNNDNVIILKETSETQLSSVHKTDFRSRTKRVFFMRVLNTSFACVCFSKGTDDDEEDDDCHGNRQ